MSRFTLTLEIHEVPDPPQNKAGNTRGGTIDLASKRGEPISVLRVVTRGSTLLSAIASAVAHLSTAQKQEEAEQAIARDELERVGRERS